MKIVDKFLGRLLGRALRSRYQVLAEERLIYMDASEPISEVDKALMLAILQQLTKEN